MPYELHSLLRVSSYIQSCLPEMCDWVFRYRQGPVQKLPLPTHLALSQCPEAESPSSTKKLFPYSIVWDCVTARLMAIDRKPFRQDVPRWKGEDRGKRLLYTLFWWKWIIFGGTGCVLPYHTRMINGGFRWGHDGNGSSDYQPGQFFFLSWQK